MQKIKNIDSYTFIRANKCSAEDITVKPLQFSVCGITSPISPSRKSVKSQSIYYNRLAHTNLSTTSDHNSYTETCNAIISTIFLEEEVDKAGVDKKERGEQRKKSEEIFSFELGWPDPDLQWRQETLNTALLHCYNSSGPSLGSVFVQGWRPPLLPIHSRLSLANTIFYTHLFLHILMKSFLCIYLLWDTRIKVLSNTVNAWRYLVCNF